MTETPRLARILTALAIVILILLTARMFGPAALSSDDFKNLSFAQLISARTMLESNLRPANNIFRPVGMTVYWILWQVFGLDPFPYRVVAMVIHLLNVALVYSILRFAAGSEFCAALGALLFASQPAFASIFYDFGTIFELLTALWFFLALRIYFSAGHTIPGMLLVSLACFLANNSKEMAVTLPAVLLLYELLIGRRWKTSAARTSRAGMLGVLCRQLLIPTLIVLWFFLVKLPGLRAIPPSDPYFMEFSGVALGRGYGWYFNSLYQTHLRWAGWMIIATFAGAVFVWKRWRWALFFLLYVFLALIPVVFLIHHRYEFYWYVPCLGLCGLIALLVRSALSAAANFSKPAGALALMGVFGLLWIGQYVLVERQTRQLRERVDADAREHLNFVQDLRSQARPEPGDTIYYRSVPRTFDLDTIPAATQVALERSDLQGKLVEQYPAGAKWRFRFENSRLIRD